MIAAGSKVWVDRAAGNLIAGPTPIVADRCEVIGRFNPRWERDLWLVRMPHGGENVVHESMMREIP